MLQVGTRQVVRKSCQTPQFLASRTDTLIVASKTISGNTVTHQSVEKSGPSYLPAQEAYHHQSELLCRDILIPAESPSRRGMCIFAASLVPGVMEWGTREWLVSSSGGCSFWIILYPPCIAGLGRTAKLFWGVVGVGMRNIFARSFCLVYLRPYLLPS